MKKSRNITEVEQTPGVIAPELPTAPEQLVRSEPDRSRTPRPAKRYRYRFSPVIFGALLLGLALCIAGFALTTWFFAGFLSGGDLSNVYEWLQYTLLYVASVGIGLFIVAVLLRSEYVLTDSALIVRLGFLRSRTPLEDIVSIHLFRGALIRDDAAEILAAHRQRQRSALHPLTREFVGYSVKSYARQERDVNADSRE